MSASGSESTSRFPFLFGTQYYRAPTPEPECWEMDFRGMRELGFNAVKLTVQWRWSHRGKDRFFFEDLDRLMDLSAKHGLGVTLNFFLDVSPIWLFETYPDAKPVSNNGHVIEPCAVAHRQIGGHPGPCYRHPGALADRQRFVAATVEHFRDHPALQMWDVWNEPELCFPQRTPDISMMVCYCQHCGISFRDWLHAKYGSVEHLNSVWGRCYETWEQVELPRGTGTITDFIDWREFHLDTMASEAAWRLDMVERLDPRHGRYLHVVPNSYFSAVTCTDDFAMAEYCEVFASTTNGGPVTCLHTISAGRGKVCYNVESHVNYGCTDIHQPEVGLRDLMRDFLPQLGMGIKGILFWQYRSEVLGLEAPAWGLVGTDGGARPVTEAVRRFWATLRPHADELRTAFLAPAQTGIWRSRKNEIFHFCTQGKVDAFNASLAAYIEALYWENLPLRIVNGGMLAAGELDGLKMLIMPSCYYVTQEEAESLDRWVRAGGVLVCEAHLAGYNGTTGRHSRTVPGCGLAESWGIREAHSTSSIHLCLEGREGWDIGSLPEDVRKALKELGTTGSRYFPIRMTDGTIAWGAHRYAEIAGEGLETLGRLGLSAPCIAWKPIGKGVVFYCGTDLGQAAAEKDPTGLLAVVRMAAAAAGIEPSVRLRADMPATVHCDILCEANEPSFAVVVSRADKEQAVRINGDGRWQGIYTGSNWELGGETSVMIPAGFSDLFRIGARG